MMVTFQKKCPSSALKIMQTIRGCAKGQWQDLKKQQIPGIRSTTSEVETSAPLLLGDDQRGDDKKEISTSGVVLLLPGVLPAVDLRCTLLLST